MGGEIDGFVDIRAAGVGEQLTHVDASDGAADQLAHVGKRKLQIGVRGEIDDGGLVKRRERVDQREAARFISSVSRRTLGLASMTRATLAGWRRGVEIGDGLRNAVVKDAEIVRGAGRGRGPSAVKRCR